MRLKHTVTGRVVDREPGPLASLMLASGWIEHPDDDDIGPAAVSSPATTTGDESPTPTPSRKRPSKETTT